MEKGSLHQRSLGNAKCQGRRAWAGRLTGQLGLGLASAGRPVSCRTMGMVVAPTYRVRATLSSSAKAPAPGPDQDWIGPAVRACLEVTAEPRCGQAVVGWGHVFYPVFWSRDGTQHHFLFFRSAHLLAVDIFTEPVEQMLGSGAPLLRNSLRRARVF